MNINIKFLVAGARFRGDYYKTGAFEEGQKVILEPEPTNQYDPNAIKVIHAGNVLGYVPRTHNQSVALLMTKPYVATLDSYHPDKKAEERFGIKVEAI